MTYRYAVQGETLEALGWGDEPWLEWDVEEDIEGGAPETESDHEAGYFPGPVELVYVVDANGGQRLARAMAEKAGAPMGPDLQLVVARDKVRGIWVVLGVTLPLVLQHIPEGAVLPTQPVLCDIPNTENAQTPLEALTLGAVAMANAAEHYDDKADRFYRATGRIAPGKDAPAALGGTDPAERMAAWMEWLKTDSPYTAYRSDGGGPWVPVGGPDAQ